MKPLSTSVYTFENLIAGGFQYIDKTAVIHHLLLSTSSGQFFLSRPRRFGKSLLVSTLKAIFLGKKALFDGLAISNTDYDWKAYPVIHIDLGTSQVQNAEELERKLGDKVNEQAKVNGISLSLQGAASRLEELIFNLASRGRVVILIDEYDKPLLGVLDNPQKAGEILPVLKAFYSVIKGTESSQRFALLTGVSKFSKVSVFSDLNNLTDLTMDGLASILLGYTQEELEVNFSDRIDALVTKENISRADLLEKIRLWYNGYRFSENAPTVYNPVSVMKLLDSGKFRSFWFETGTPSFLIQLLKSKGTPLSELSAMRLGEQGFSSYEVDNLAIEPLLYQTGYVTIKHYDPLSRIYTLGYPNLEVENAFIENLVDAFTSVGKGRIEALVYDIATSLEQTNLDQFFSLLRVIFASIPYEIQISNEKYYQTVFHLVLTLLGLKTQVEIRTEAGRIDAVIETRSCVFIFEFKLKGLAKTALKQIKDKRYFEKYLASEKGIVLIGVVFDKKTRNLGKYLTEWLRRLSL